MITESLPSGQVISSRSTTGAGWSRWLHALFATEPLATTTFARIVLGAAILPHGAQKLFGWFGGYGFTATLHWFTDTMHVPWILGLAAILAETVGGLALLVGFATRLAAAAVGVVFLTAVILVHARHGFFINWFGNQKGEGVEYFVLGFALVVLLVVQGGGAASVDRAVATRGFRSGNSHAPGGSLEAALPPGSKRPPAHSPPPMGALLEKEEAGKDWGNFPQTCSRAVISARDPFR